MTDCTGFTSSSTCMGSNIDKTSASCVWQTSTCIVDPCVAKSGNWNACASDSTCVGILGSNSNIQCFAIQRVCSYLTSDSCQTYPWCLKSATGDSCMYYVPGQGVDGNTSQDCLSFPLWSIALIVLWVLVMIILGGVVVLAIRQRRLDMITEVEESEVHVDNVAVSHRDNFAPRDDLERRLNDDDY
ncbi:transmembrane protein, putative [Bodo saltans]|uniref:Transmembrane protein, putative n=1 Tax=Bodo saltans TaxID=75058 RepID=A0A0S4IHL5_BODSA|nr:transmembrane protein, putative [Bodo saltans]|eukprot:CUE66470.1 transmembrane protein, putative [Bodo saltans]